MPEGHVIKLHDYQKYALDFMLARPKCEILLPTGSGKSLTTLCMLYVLNPTGQVLIVAPPAIILSTWSDEIEKWGFPFRTRSLVVKPSGAKLSAKQRRAIYEEIPSSEPTVWYITMDTLATLVTRFAPPTPWPFQMTIADEVQRFKDPTRTRSKAMADAALYSERFIGLTGTAMSRGYEDIWGEAYLVDRGARLERSLFQFHRRYYSPGNVIVNNRNVTWDIRPGSDRAIMSAVSDIMVSIGTPGMTLPPLIVNDIKVHMSPEERKLYEHMRVDMALAIANDVLIAADDKDVKKKMAEGLIDAVIARNGAALQTKLLQMASGFLYKQEDDGSKTVMRIHERKYEMVEDLVENADSPLIVCYWFKEDLRGLTEYLIKHGQSPVAFDNSPQMQADWNAGRIPVMLVQPASSAWGLNIQKGGHTIIWLTLPSSIEVYQQMNARLNRQGQTSQVTIHRILTAGTADVTKRLPRLIGHANELANATELVRAVIPADEIRKQALSLLKKKGPSS